MTKQANVPHLTDAQVLGDRKWGPTLTVEQMRSQMQHEANGCPPPFPGAVWNGHCFVAGR